MKIIFAQGNPEPEYSGSRHNIGFEVLNNLAKEYNAEWIKKPKFYAYAAEITINEEKLILVKPTTFYNETSTSARKFIDFYKIDQSVDFLVVHDDLDLPFGTIRVRQQGSDGGNNGIKSLNSHINANYTRIRIGILTDHNENIDDTDFVLSKFDKEESAQLSKTIVPQAIELIKQFCSGGITPTSYKI